MAIERLIVDGLSNSPDFPQAVVATGTRLVFVNGQVGRDAENRLVGADDLRAQARQAWENVRLALAAAGATGRDVVQTRVSVVGYSFDRLPAILEPCKEVFGADPVQAPSIVAGVVALGRPEYLIEIEAVAVLP